MHCRLPVIRAFFRYLHRKCRNFIFRKQFWLSGFTWMSPRFHLIKTAPASLKNRPFFQIEEVRAIIISLPFLTCLIMPFLSSVCKADLGESKLGRTGKSGKWLCLKFVRIGQVCGFWKSVNIDSRICWTQTNRYDDSGRLFDSEHSSALQHDMIRYEMLF